MLEQFVVFNKGGLILWSYTFEKPKGEPVNDLIQTILIEVHRLLTSNLILCFFFCRVKCGCVMRSGVCFTEAVPRSPRPFFATLRPWCRGLHWPASAHSTQKYLLTMLIYFLDRSEAVWTRSAPVNTRFVGSSRMTSTLSLWFVDLHAPDLPSLLSIVEINSSRLTFNLMDAFLLRV